MILKGWSGGRGGGREAEEWLSPDMMKIGMNEKNERMSRIGGEACVVDLILI